MSIGLLSTRPHYFYCPSPDFTTPIVSQSVTNNRCAPSCGGHKRKVRGHIKKFSAGAKRRHCDPPLANCFRRHCTLRQSYVCAVAYSGHFCFRGDLTKPSITIASVDRFYLNLVICLQLDIALLERERERERESLMCLMVCLMVW